MVRLQLPTVLDLCTCPVHNRISAGRSCSTTVCRYCPDSRYHKSHARFIIIKHVCPRRNQPVDVPFEQLLEQLEDTPQW